MSTKDTYNNVLEKAANLEVATETVSGHVPNVRTVNYVYFPNESANTIYFITSKDANKVKEITANNQVSFTTSPSEAGTVRVTGATATDANDKKDEIFTEMTKRYSDFQMDDQKARDGMQAYGLTFTEAEVIGADGGKVEF
ncbi:pyridoxamine 5'-phosphate oxidase family protein [Secundilactobacillus folii]|uniref:Pyridoxamine 5'-phosphate oxidase N-terminal domain-containing protein n=1 Tax=Secundilactobacillus folii TaxID=2678357 RepID=A0A7X2XUE0_9LACO|nr:pyridoxamine 5'-phosphate oxidase family protein [Secundilactobacillus folii]MTV81759.1 hypothetical protein [Secundilactobacillus folii]